MKKYVLTLVAAALCLGTIGCTSMTSTSSVKAPIDFTPKSVLHVVTVAWKADAKPEQIQAALEAVKALPAAYPGITHVWVKSIKVQNPEGTVKKRTHVFVMEFKDEQALKDYAGSAAQKEWYKVYQPVRDESTTHDITN